MRPQDTCKSMNNGIIFNLIRKGACFISAIVTNHRLKTFSRYYVQLHHVGKISNLY